MATEDAIEGYPPTQKLTSAECQVFPKRFYDHVPSSALAAPTAFLRHRVAVAIMFLMNGLLVGGWAPAIPVFKDKHALAESGWAR